VGRHRPERGRDGLIALETAGGTLVYGTAHGRPIGAEGVFSVRTIHLGLSREAPPAQANVWPVRVRRSVFQGDFTQYQVDWEDRQLVVRCTAADPLAEGEQAYLAVEPRRCVLLEAEPAPA